MSSRGSSEHYRLVEEAFQRAADLPRDRRAEFLDRQCGTDGALRGEVDDLLRSYEAAGEMFDRPLYDRGDAAGDAPDPVQIGRYKVVRRLGQGGMAVVYEAAQDQPRRSVAVKIIRPGGFSASSRRRFEVEAAALARLQHPGIAHIYDAGMADVAYEAGAPLRQPYFAMELVQGEPLLRYAERHRLNMSDRLALFIQICGAVEHAHQKGVIHRDLKPSNILVTPTGQPKVLDFGVARVTDSDLQMASMHTDACQLVGTLAYMSPEQVNGKLDELDTRSDVYALGVILYELLVGRQPYDVGRQPIAAAARLITETTPTPPSAVARYCRGDLDIIIAKALEKDPARRYASASALAADVQRHLDSEPIAARAPGAAYVLRKFAARNRVLVGGVAATLVALLLGVAGTSFGLLRSEQRRAELVIARKNEERQRKNAEAQRTLAERRAEQVSRVAEYQARMLSDIDIEAMGRGITEYFVSQVRGELERRSPGSAASGDTATPGGADGALAALNAAISPGHPADVGRQVMDEFVLRPAAEALGEAFPDQPLIRASIHNAIGRAYAALGLPEQALPQLQEALALRRNELGPNDALVAESLDVLSSAQCDVGDLPGGEQSSREALAIRRGLPGADPGGVAQSLCQLGRLLRQKGELDEAEAVYREALDEIHRANEEGDPDPEALEALILQNLAVLLKHKGDYTAAESLYREAIELARERLGDRHVQVARYRGNLAALLMSRGDLAAAEPLFRDALAVHREQLGDQHPTVALIRRKLGRLLRQKGDLEGAAVELAAAVESHRGASDEDVDFGICLGELATLLQDKGEYDAAEPLFRQALEIHRRLLGDDHPHAATGLVNLALLLDKKGDATAAEPLYREAIEIYRRRLGDEHPYVAAVLCNLALLLEGRGNAEAAEPLYREALRISTAALPASHPTVLAGRIGLGRTLADLRRYAEAEPHLLAAYESSADPERTVQRKQAVEGLIRLYDAWHAAEPEGGFDAQAAQWRSRS